MAEIDPLFPQPLANLAEKLAGIAGTVAILGLVLLVLGGVAVLRLDVRVPGGLIWAVACITAVTGVLWLLVAVGMP